MVEVRGESIFIEWAFYLKFFFFSFCITVQKRVGIYIWWVGTYKVNKKISTRFLKIIFFLPCGIWIFSGGNHGCRENVLHWFKSAWGVPAFGPFGFRKSILVLGWLVQLGLRIELGVSFVFEWFNRQRARPGVSNDNGRGGDSRLLR